MNIVQAMRLPEKPLNKINTHIEHLLLRLQLSQPIFRCFANRIPRRFVANNRDRIFKLYNYMALHFYMHHAAEDLVEHWYLRHVIQTITDSDGPCDPSIWDPC